MKVPKHTLPVIVFAQFTGTSLWFAGNAILPQIQEAWGLPGNSLAQVTSAVMLGFILGTFTFALLSIADRFHPSQVFLICSLLGAFSNVILLLITPSYFWLMVSRILTGVFLAGIYPVGMKIASDWYGRKTGKALGYLVGALVLGSAFPHLLNHLGADYTWQFVLIGTSILATVGGFMMFFLVGGGHHRQKGAHFKPTRLFDVFKNKPFRAAAFGYFGHMWELYAFWAFVPMALVYYNETHAISLPVSLWTFIIMGVGVIGCIFGGIISERLGSAKVAYRFLWTSGLLCLISPFLYVLPPVVFLSGMLLWGFAVIGDSAQYSSLNAITASPQLKGTALTLAVSIGFLLTIPSIQLLGYLQQVLEVKWLLFTLCIGPAFGLFHTQYLLKSKAF